MWGGIGDAQAAVNTVNTLVGFFFKILPNIWCQNDDANGME